METGEEASIQKDIQTRLWDLMVWESEASMRPGAGSYPSQGSGVKDSGGNSEVSVCSEKDPNQAVVRACDPGTPGGRGKGFISVHSQMVYLVSSQSGLCYKTFKRKNQTSK